jgi:hypothetical protein
MTICRLKGQGKTKPIQSQIKPIKACPERSRMEPIRVCLIALMNFPPDLKKVDKSQLIVEHITKNCYNLPFSSENNVFTVKKRPKES